MKRRVLLIGAVVLTMFLTAMPSQAAEITAYLSWTQNAIGPCVGTTPQKLAYSGMAFSPPANVRTKLRKVTTNGNVQTIEYNQNGVTKADIYRFCQNGVYKETYVPRAYATRTIYQNYLCYGASCQLAYIKTTAWRSGLGDPR